MNKDAQLKVGQTVFIINRKIEIEEKKVFAVVFEKEKIRYQLEEKQCGGSQRTEIFLTKGQAEKAKQDFLDKLRFKIGDLVICKYRDYSNTKRKIGRVSEIYYNKESPYKITFGGSEYTTDINDSDMVIKIKNDYIEDFENMNELTEEFIELEKQIDEVNFKIRKLYDRVEEELQASFKKHYSLFGKPKKIKFEDRFIYENDNDWD